MHYKDYLVKNKIQLRFILLNAWAKLWTLFDIERVYVSIVFWTNIMGALDMRQVEILSPQWNKFVIAYIYKIRIVFHNIRNKSLLNSRKRTLN